MITYIIQQPIQEASFYNQKYESSEKIEIKFELNTSSRESNTRLLLESLLNASISATSVCQSPKRIQNPQREREREVVRGGGDSWP